MKKFSWQHLLYLSIIVIILAGCGSFITGQQTISPERTSPVQPTLTLYPTYTPYQTFTPYPTYTPYTTPASTPLLMDSWVYPPGVRTGIAELETITDAVLEKDIESLRGLIGYLTLACGTLDALGGPPRCAEGEPEGTLSATRWSGCSHLA